MSTRGGEKGRASRRRGRGEREREQNEKEKGSGDLETWTSDVTAR
jgi:hypothetical protein